MPNNNLDAFNEYMNEINDVKKEINDLSKKLKGAENKYQELISATICIKFSDLVQEIAKLSNINVLDLDIKISTNMFIEYKSEFIIENLSQRIYSNLEVTIKNSKSGEKLYLYFPFDFYSKFADGTILFDHCSPIKTEDEWEIVVDKRIGGLICTFSFEKLLKDSYHVSSPSLLHEAIKNCYNNGKVCSPQPANNNEDILGVK